MGRAARCKPCAIKVARAHWTANAQRHSERRKKQYWKNPEHFRALTTKWQQENPEGVSILSNRRRAVLAEAITPESVLVTKEWFRSVIAKQRGQCYYCFGTSKLTMEHVVPLARGGKHVRENIVAACWDCNRSKGVKSLEEWRAG